VEEAELEGWACYFGADGNLYAFCLDCAEREFDDRTPSS
jgi:hypothetical protein